MDAVILGMSPNSLSAARSLGRAGLTVAMVGTRSDPPVVRSRYIARFEQLEQIEETAVIDCLLRLPEQRDRPFLLATGDLFALLVAKQQDSLRSRYCFVCPSHAVLESIIDKAKLYETAKANGFAHPKFHIVRDRSDVDAAIAAVPTPCYVKPALAHHRRRFTKSKLERAETVEELRRTLLDFIDNGLVAIPLEIIPGSDSEVFSVSTYIDRFGKPAGWRTKRKLRQYPLRAGDASAQEICDRPDVAEIGLRLLAVTGHRGPATVEFRRDERDGRLVLMEINARTILGQEMITRSGLDVPLIAYHDAKALPLPPANPTVPVRWIHLASDYRAFRELRRDGAITSMAWLASIASCRAFAYFALDDLAPWFASTSSWITSHTHNNRSA
jgi:predicted ATP-grasp superfamily ATP-dependent carboligase